MTDPIAFYGTYADLKFIKTRSVAQVVVEIPIEQSQKFVAEFGAPIPGVEIPVAVARLVQSTTLGAEAPLTPHGEKTEAEKPKRKPAETRAWQDLPYSQQAGISCNDEQYQQWIWERDGGPTGWGPSKEHAEAVTRSYCNVASRAELDSNEEAATLWEVLDTRFREDTGRTARQTI